MPYVPSCVLGANGLYFCVGSSTSSTHMWKTYTNFSVLPWWIRACPMPYYDCYVYTHILFHPVFFLCIFALLLLLFSAFFIGLKASNPYHLRWTYDGIYILHSYSPIWVYNICVCMYWSINRWHNHSSKFAIIIIHKCALMPLMLKTCSRLHKELVTDENKFI